MLRRLLCEQLKRVEQGLDPINTMRDPSANKRIPTGAWNKILSPAEAAALPYREDLRMRAPSFRASGGGSGWGDRFHGG